MVLSLFHSSDQAFRPLNHSICTVKQSLPAPKGKGHAATDQLSSSIAYL
jgi:hypothetical protein